MLSTVIEHTGPRYERLLLRSGAAAAERFVDPNKFEVTRRIDGEAVLLVDDTWTTGATAQSAAGRLKEAGASAVSVVVLGRHIHEEYENNAARLRELPRPFDWAACALE